MKGHFRNETEKQRELRLSIVGKTRIEATELFCKEPEYSLAVVWENGMFKRILKGNKKQLRVGIVDGKIVETFQADDCGIKSTYLMEWH